MIRTKYAPISEPELDALKKYAAYHGRRWKEALSTDWYNARAIGILHSLRNSHGPKWLAGYRLPESPRHLMRGQSITVRLLPSGETRPAKVEFAQAEQSYHGDHFGYSLRIKGKRTRTWIAHEQLVLSTTEGGAVVLLTEEAAG